MLIFYYPFLIN